VSLSTSCVLSGIAHTESAVVIRQGREETGMAESRPAVQTTEQEGTVQAVEAGAGILGRV